MANPTIKELITASLTRFGFDGLFNDDNECGCEIADLMPCQEFCGDCEAGYKWKPTPEVIEEYGNVDFIICRLPVTDFFKEDK